MTTPRHAFARAVLGALALTLPALVAAPASAAVYLTGSVSGSTTNAGLQTYESEGAAASIAFDIGTFMRLGFTHKQQIQRTKGWTGETADDCAFDTDVSGCKDYKSRTHVTANSIDLTVILYPGEVVVPFLLGGVIVKSYETESTRGTGDDAVVEKAVYPSGPVPNIGGGLSFRLSKQFSLKLQYTASPGVMQKPDGTEQRLWDKDASIGLTYQL
jgi:hypothetical protein